MKKVAMMIGLPAAGKSSIVKSYTDQGYNKLSRDEIGGAVDGLMFEKFNNLLRQGVDKIILDNTFTLESQRKPYIDAAKAKGYEVTAVHITTSAEDCMVNSVTRMIKKHGRPFMDANEIKLSAVKDPNLFPIAAIYSGKKNFQKPASTEGFDNIITEKFKRLPSEYKNKAIIFDYDDTLRKTKNSDFYPTWPDNIEILPGRSEKITELKKQGYIILGVSNQSGVAKGYLTEEMAHKCFKKTNELLGHDIDYRFCKHSVPPITCYCRKPGVGFGVEFIEKYKLDPSQCIMVGDLKTDETFAKRCGFKFVDAHVFFKQPVIA